MLVGVDFSSIEVFTLKILFRMQLSKYINMTLSKFAIVVLCSMLPHFTDKSMDLCTARAFLCKNPADVIADTFPWSVALATRPL